MFDSAGKINGKAMVTAVTAGLIATAVTGLVNRLLDPLVTEEQKRRDRQVRKGTAHDLAGPYLVEKVSGKELGEKGAQRARTIFSISYSLIWGMVYAGVRRKMPQTSRLAGLPFAIPFFFACDGVLAPLLGVSPSLRRVPWQPSAKEMANHVAWTATAEMIHRLAGRRRALGG